jgi:hypothetical protein
MYSGWLRVTYWRIDSPSIILVPVLVVFISNTFTIVTAIVTAALANIN